MSEVHHVQAQVRPPSGDDVGQVTDGYYIIENNTLIMTYSDGAPIHAELFRQELRPGQDSRAIAGLLTRKVRLSLLGKTEAQENFNRRIEYGHAGVV